MPPPHHHRAPGLHQPSVPASRALSFVDPVALDGVLQPLLPDATERAFVLRCLIGEGPIHHRGANYVLLSLLARMTAAGDQASMPAPIEASVPVPMRLPPHLADQVESAQYPLLLPTAALQRLAGGDADRLAAMVDCLTDGPAQHVLANVVMVALMDRMLVRHG